VSSLVVAIDGPAGAGKSSVARDVAAQTGLTLVDTGAIYRALALAAHEAGVSFEDEDAVSVLAVQLPITFRMERGVNRVFLDGRDVSDLIRRPEISMGASTVSKHPAVRAALLQLQRDLGREGAVLEGRDIGTVVFPNAPIKVFLNATPNERARRRAHELAERGQAQPYDQVLSEIQARDKQDSERPTAPLKPADDAEQLDSTKLTEAEVVAHIVRRVWEARA
jgi:cytidylate kinase